LPPTSHPTLFLCIMNNNSALHSHQALARHSCNSTTCPLPPVSLPSCISCIATSSIPNLSRSRTFVDLNNLNSHTGPSFHMHLFILRNPTIVYCSYSYPPSFPWRFHLSTFVPNLASYFVCISSFEHSFRSSFYRGTTSFAPHTRVFYLQFFPIRGIVRTLHTFSP